MPYSVKNQVTDLSDWGSKIGMNQKRQYPYCFYRISGHQKPAMYKTLNLLQRLWIS